MAETITYTLTLKCADQTGIVASVAQGIAAMGGNIIESSQFNDPENATFFMRVEFTATGFETPEDVRKRLGSIITAYDMDAHVVETDRFPKIILMVSNSTKARSSNKRPSACTMRSPPRITWLWAATSKAGFWPARCACICRAGCCPMAPKQCRLRRARSGRGDRSRSANPIEFH